MLSSPIMGQMWQICTDVHGGLIGFPSDIPAQEKMTLKAAIMYKSNWQQGSLKGSCLTFSQFILY